MAQVLTSYKQKWLDASPASWKDQCLSACDRLRKRISQGCSQYDPETVQDYGWNHGGWSHHRQHAATTSHVGGRCKRRREISAQDVAILPIKEFSAQRDNIHVILSTMAGLPNYILKQ